MVRLSARGRAREITWRVGGGVGGGGGRRKKRQDKRGWAVTGEVATPLAEVAYANQTSSAILSARQGSHDRWPPTQGD